MDHETMLDTMLAHNCSNPAGVPWADGVNEYHFEGHCSQYTVWARLRSTMGDCRYDVFQIWTTP